MGISFSFLLDCFVYFKLKELVVLHWTLLITRRRSHNRIKCIKLESAKLKIVLLINHLAFGGSTTVPKKKIFFNSAEKKMLFNSAESYFEYCYFEKSKMVASLILEGTNA